MKINYEGICRAARPCELENIITAVSTSVVSIVAGADRLAANVMPIIREMQRAGSRDGVSTVGGSLPYK
jgi:hypothetical protein